MSLAYKLFRIPRNLEEFVDKIKKRGDSSVDIVLTKRIGGVFGSMRYPNHYSDLDIYSGKTKIRLGMVGRWDYNNQTPKDYEPIASKRDSLVVALRTAEKVNGLGLVATINGKSISHVKKEIKQYKKKMDKMMAKYKTLLEKKHKVELNQLMESYERRNKTPN